MHNNRSLSRELSLISLGLIKDKGDFKLGPRVVALGQKGATAILKELERYMSSPYNLVPLEIS